MKPTQTPAKTSALLWAKDVLVVPNRERMARLFDLPHLPRPIRVFLKGGYLTWTWYRQTAKSKKSARKYFPKRQEPRLDLCFRFAQLADASDEKIRAFAEEWGPLGLRIRAEEHLDEWRRHAGRAAALLRFSAALVSGTEGSSEDWLTIRKLGKLTKIDRSELTPVQQKAITALALNKWFFEMPGRWILEMVGDQLHVRPGASNLLGLLIVQIAHAMARADETAECFGCKNPFRPKRARSRGSRRYCRKCRKAKVPQRDAARDWRARARAKL